MGRFEVITGPQLLPVLSAEDSSDHLTVEFHCLSSPITPPLDQGRVDDNSRHSQPQNPGHPVRSRLQAPGEISVLAFVFRRVWVVAMAVCPLDSAIPSMDDQFGLLPLAQFPAIDHGLVFSVKMP